MKLKKFGIHLEAGTKEREFYITSIEIELNKTYHPRFTATLSSVKPSHFNKRIALILTKIAKRGKRKKEVKENEAN
mgnify:CR=1 FL=1